MSNQQKARLEDYLAKLEAYQALSGHRPNSAAKTELLRLEPAVKAIIKSLDPSLDFNFDAWGGMADAHNAVNRALGIIEARGGRPLVSAPDAAIAPVHAFDGAQFESQWPRELAAVELDRLLRRGRNAELSPAGHDEAYWFLTEVFSAQAADEFTRLASLDMLSFDPVAARQEGYEWLRELRAALPLLPVAQPRAPYWSRRRAAAGQPQGKVTIVEVARDFGQLIDDFDRRGYFSEAFGEPCVDGDTPGNVGDPRDEVASQFGRENLWPVAEYAGTYSSDDLYDMIEFLHDHVSRPLTRTLHEHSECGWHSHGYYRDRGRQVYRWQVNRLLERSALGVTLTAEGRLEMLAPEALEDLVTSAREHVGVMHQSDESELMHAIAQFRARDAALLDRRAAVVTLAGILERRRATVKACLAGKDEGALFQIANEFGIRHQRANQHTDYDQDLYLEWIFYWYVATLHLTDRITARQTSGAVTMDGSGPDGGPSHLDSDGSASQAPTA